MKKYLILALVVLTGIASSCKYDDDEVWDSVNNLADRVANLEAMTKQMNSDIAAMQSIVTAMQNKLTVTEVEELADGYILHFSDGTQATIKNGADGKDGANGEDGKDGADGENGKDGKDGKDAPVVGVAQEDGVYYWTMTIDGKTEWLTDEDGNKMRVSGVDGEDGKDGSSGSSGSTGADGVTPKLQVSTAGYWQVSYDNGKTYANVLDANGNPVKARGENGAVGDSWFQSIAKNGDKVSITLLEGNKTYELPLAASVTYKIGDTVLEGNVVPVAPGSSVDLTFTVNGMSNPSVEVIKQENVKVTVSGNTLTVKATEPYAEEGKVVILYYNANQTITSALTVNIDVVTGASDLQAKLDAGGTIFLGGNLTVTEPLTVAAGKTVTLDLCGYTLTLGTEEAGIDGNGIVNNGNLTIKDGSIAFSAATGKTNWPAGQYADMTAAIRNNATATLTNVTIESNVYTVNNYGTWNTTGSQKVVDQEVTATLTISGGNYVSTKNSNNDPNGPNAYSIMCVDNAKVIISGSASIKGAGGGLAVCWAFADLNDCTLTGDNSASTGAHDLYMIGGSQVTYTSETTLAHNNKRLQDESANGTNYVPTYGACSYTKKTLVSDNNGLKTALAENGMVVLMSNMQVAEQLNIANDKNVVLDLNSKTLTISGIAKSGLKNEGSLTIKNGTIVYESSATEFEELNKNAAIWNQKGVLTLNNVNITSNNTYAILNYGDWTSGSILEEQGDPTTKITINGGTITSTANMHAQNGNHIYAIYTQDNAMLTVKGGAVIEGDGSININCSKVNVENATLKATCNSTYNIYMLSAAQVTVADGVTMEAQSDVNVYANKNSTQYGAISYNNTTYDSSQIVVSEN